MNYAEQVLTEVRRAIVGKDDMILKTFLTMISGGHLLLEDKPGVGKTTLAVAFSPAPLPMDFLAPVIWAALRIRLGISRSTITSSKDNAGIRLPKRQVNLSLVSTVL